jgi:hypothetical protein
VSLRVRPDVKRSEASRVLRSSGRLPPVRAPNLRSLVSAIVDVRFPRSAPSASPRSLSAPRARERHGSALPSGRGAAPVCRTECRATGPDCAEPAQSPLSKAVRSVSGLASPAFALPRSGVCGGLAVAVLCFHRVRCAVRRGGRPGIRLGSNGTLANRLEAHFGRTERRQMPASRTRQRPLMITTLCESPRCVNPHAGERVSLRSLRADAASGPQHHGQPTRPWLT